MPLARITNQGLVAIACAVALLWACILGERVLMTRAYAERAAVMRTLAPAGIRHAQPVRAPSLRSPRPRHFVAG